MIRDSLREVVLKKVKKLNKIFEKRTYKISKQIFQNHYFSIFNIFLVDVTTKFRNSMMFKPPDSVTLFI